MTTTLDTAPRTTAMVDSPIGPLTLVARGDALVGVHMHEQRHLPDLVDVPTDPGSSDVLAAARSQLAEYFAGRRTAFELPLSLQGTTFQQRVWRALCEIPYGETWTYGELAREIGQPTASRAVGLANGRNPVAIVVPCHRVIGTSGKLVGYGGGMDRKRFLLDLERGAAPLS